MFDNPMLQLAFSVYNNPGVYALLLGSGVSRAAGIPTGWEVINDLICQIATIEGENQPTDPYSWFKKKFDQEPTYDGLVEALGKSSFERNAILRPYFEPNDDEREEGIIKMPTNAHEAIAWLIKQGYIRVVLTTNFDHLLEQALEGIGVRPDIVRSDSQLKGMRLLSHSEITIIKLHGDYLDGDFKNTPQELAVYSTQMNKLLDQIFDEYGLIVCGWSGEWDVALREAIERTTQRRYSTYWCAYTTPSTIAQGLIDHRDAETISNMSANEFFNDLRQKTEALAKFNRQHPLSKEVAIARTKKLIPYAEQQIELEDLVRAEIERAYRAFTSEKFITKRDEIIQKNSNADCSSEIWDLYLGSIEIALHVMLTLAWYGNEYQARLLTEAVSQWMENPADYSQRHSPWRYLPVLALIYVCGIASVYNHNWHFVKASLIDPRIREKHANRRHLPIEVIAEEFKGNLRTDIERNQSGSKLEEILHDWCRSILCSLIPVSDNYNYAFDLFDMFVALLYLAYNSKGKKDWFPSQLAVTNSRSWEYICDFWREGGRQGGNWALLTCGLFSSDRMKLYETLQNYVSRAQEHQGAMAYPVFRDFAEIYFRPDAII